MADFDPQVAQQLTEALSRDPVTQQLRAILQRAQTGKTTPQDYAILQQVVGKPFENRPDRLIEAANVGLIQRAQQLGVPGAGSGYTVDPQSGGVRETEGVPGWAQAAGWGIAGLAAAPFALNALGAGAGSASTAGGAEGIGEAVGSGGGVLGTAATEPELAAAGGTGVARNILGQLGGWGGLAEAGLKVAGGLAQGRAQERLAEAELASRADATRLGAANFNRQTPSVRAGNAVRGDVLAGVQPYALAGEGRNISGSGGLSPALLSENTRNLGREMNRQAFLSQMGQGGATDPYANFVPTNASKANGLDTALGIAGVVGSALPLVGGLPFLKPKTPLPQPEDINDIYGRYGG